MAASIGRTIGKSSLTTIKDVGFLSKNQLSPLYNITPVMYMRNKHYNPKFRKARMLKTLYVDKNEYYDQFNLKPNTPEYKEWSNKRFKQSKGAQWPMRSYTARPVTVLDSGGVIDPFVPLEGDGSRSILRKQGLQNAVKMLTKKLNARLRAERNIRKHGEENFNTKTIAPELQQIYLDAHNLLTDFKKNKKLLHNLVTPHCFSKMAYNMEKLTLRWEFIENIEPPKVVHVVFAQGHIKDEYMAQVTLRIHSKQRLEMYDQFGRLMFGDRYYPKDVLEFVVFEKNIVNLYGKWKMMDKVTPDWLPQTHKINTFYVHEKPGEEDEVSS